MPPNTMGYRTRVWGRACLTTGWGWAMLLATSHQATHTRGLLYRIYEGFGQDAPIHSSLKTHPW